MNEASIFSLYYMCITINNRPTFDYLKSTLYDFYVLAAEGAYKENVGYSDKINLASCFRTCV